MSGNAVPLQTRGGDMWLKIKPLLSFIWHLFMGMGVLGGAVGLIFDRFVEGVLAGWAAALILLLLSPLIDAESIYKRFYFFTVPLFLIVLGVKWFFFTPTVNIVIPDEVALYNCRQGEEWACRQAAKLLEDSINSFLNGALPFVGAYALGLGIITLLISLFYLFEEG